ncbi:unnamed protein product, partial [Amoebophrya sp. A25]
SGSPKTPCSSSTPTSSPFGTGSETSTGATASNVVQLRRRTAPSPQRGSSSFTLAGSQALLPSPAEPTPHDEQRQGRPRRGPTSSDPAEIPFGAGTLPTSLPTKGLCTRTPTTTAMPFPSISSATTSTTPYP